MRGFHDGLADHFVIFFWSEEAGRVAMEYVVPRAGAQPIEVRTYDRAAGARYVMAEEHGAWVVRGRPSEVVACPVSHPSLSRK